MTRRLYLQVYLAMVAVLVVFAVSSLTLWSRGPRLEGERSLLEAIAVVLEEQIPGPEAPEREIQAVLERLGRAYPVELAVFSSDGEQVASLGRRMPPPEPGRSQNHWLERHGGPTVAVRRLTDGRWLVLRHPRHPGGGLAWLGALALLAAAVAAVAYPVARGVTRRVERLRSRVEELAAGDLGARVEVEGHDEVAALAASFNRAAERIEGLVKVQRTLLASASHALRSPLARIRVAVELLSQRGDRELRDRVSRDIAELDEAIGELLVASRLDILDAAEAHEPVDFLALAAEEAARVSTEVSGEPVEIRGDPHSLRHLVRNLLENARRHAPGSPIEVSITRDQGGGALLRVDDRGPGVPAGERERIFQPFARRHTPDGDEGVGLGLALVQQIARHHGGLARCLPREGGGSRFEVSLPGR